VAHEPLDRREFQETISSVKAEEAASDPTSRTRKLDPIGAPSCALEERFHLVSGRQLGDASLIRTPTL
jgi:hypothetical protein